MVVCRYEVERKGFPSQFLKPKQAYQKRVVVEEVRRFPALGQYAELAKWLEAQCDDPRTLIGSTRLVALVLDVSDYVDGPVLQATFRPLLREPWARRVRGSAWSITELEVPFRRATFFLEVARREVAAGLLSRMAAKELKVSRSPLRAELEAQVTAMKRKPNPLEEDREELARALGMCLVWYGHHERTTEDGICPLAVSLA